MCFLFFFFNSASLGKGLWVKHFTVLCLVHVHVTNKIVFYFRCIWAPNYTHTHTHTSLPSSPEVTKVVSIEWAYLQLVTLTKKAHPSNQSAAERSRAEQVSEHSNLLIRPSAHSHSWIVWELASMHCLYKDGIVVNVVSESTWLVNMIMKNIL